MHSQHVGIKIMLNVLHQKTRNQIKKRVVLWHIYLTDESEYTDETRTHIELITNQI